MQSLKGFFELKRIILKSRAGYCQTSLPFFLQGGISSLIRCHQGLSELSITISQPLLSHSPAIHSLTYKVNTPYEIPLSIDELYSLEIEKVSLNELSRVGRAAIVLSLVIALHILIFSLRGPVATSRLEKISVHLAPTAKNSFRSSSKASSPGANSLFRRATKGESRKWLSRWSLSPTKNTIAKSKPQELPRFRTGSLAAGDISKNNSVTGDTGEAEEIWNEIKPSLKRCLFDFKNEAKIRTLKTILTYSASGSLTQVSLQNVKSQNLEDCLFLALETKKLAALKNRRIEKTFHLY